MSAYLVSLVTAVGFYVLLALALNLQFGLAGLINFGIAGFFGLGAFSGAIAFETLGLSFTASVLLALALGLAAGAAVASFSLRLSGDYLAIVTLGFAEVIRLVALNEDWLTGGPRGFSITERAISQGLSRDHAALAYVLVVTLACAIVFLLVERLRASPYGRVLRALREDAAVAASTGKNVFRFRLQAFAIGSMIMAGAGALYAQYVQTITPDHFTMSVAILVWMSVILGGSGNNRGVVLGSVLVMALFEGTRFIGSTDWIDAERLSALRIVLICGLFIVVLRVRPEGLLPEVAPRREPHARSSRDITLPHPSPSTPEPGP